MSVFYTAENIMVSVRKAVYQTGPFGDSACLTGHLKSAVSRESEGGLSKWKVFVNNHITLSKQKRDCLTLWLHYWAPSDQAWVYQGIFGVAQHRPMYPSSCCSGAAILSVVWVLSALFRGRG